MDMDFGQIFGRVHEPCIPKEEEEGDDVGERLKGGKGKDGRDIVQSPTRPR